MAFFSHVNGNFISNIISLVSVIHFSCSIKGPITWGGLARLAGLARFAGISARLWNTKNQLRDYMEKFQPG